MKMQTRFTGPLLSQGELARLACQAALPGCLGARAISIHEHDLADVQAAFQETVSL
jgi:hypothetical protein